MNPELPLQTTAPIHREDYIGRGAIFRTASGQWLAKFFHPDATPRQQEFHSVVDAENYLAGLSHLYENKGS